MKNSSAIVWLTGMSGSGKSTLANRLKEILTKKNKRILIIDGDSIRDLYKDKLGFGVNDVRLNNTRIADMCNKNRGVFDLIIVPVISPYEEIRQEVRKILEPNFHLVYLKTDINSLKDRDTKGLYAASDRGNIDNLIGYSDINPYDKPKNPELIVCTSNNTSIDESFSRVFDYVIELL